MWIKLKRLRYYSHIHSLGHKQAGRAAKSAASAPLIIGDIVEKLDFEGNIGIKGYRENCGSKSIRLSSEIAFC